MQSVRKNITPIGDGNTTSSHLMSFVREVRKNITPIGVGNTLYSEAATDKGIVPIRKNITPIGDGNSAFYNIILDVLFKHKKEYNSDRRRKPVFVTLYKFSNLSR